MFATASYTKEQLQDAGKARTVVDELITLCATQCSKEMAWYIRDTCLDQASPRSLGVMEHLFCIHFEYYDLHTGQFDSVITRNFERDLDALCETIASEINAETKLAA